MGITKKTDDWYTKIEKYVTQKIGTFVAFLFLIFALGALITIQIVTRWPQHSYLVVILPLIAGVISYYNRAVATFFFIIFMFLIFLF